MKIKIISLILFSLFLSSCTRNDPDNPDYFAFGDAYGFCQANCANFFLIKDKKLYPDDLDYYLGSLEFKSHALPTNKYDLAIKLIDNFPTYLINNPDKTFGCPDCTDQGGIHIEIQENGKIIRWHFDTTITSLPIEIQDYVQEIKDILEQLK